MGPFKCIKCLNLSAQQGVSCRATYRCECTLNIKADSLVEAPQLAVLLLPSLKTKKNQIGCVCICAVSSLCAATLFPLLFYDYYFFSACSWCCNARDWCGSQDRSQDHYLRLSDSEVILLGPVSVSDWANSQFLVKTDPDSANTVVTSNQSFWSTKTQSCRTLCSSLTAIIEMGVLLVLRSGMKGFYAFCPCLTCHNFQ